MTQVQTQPADSGARASGSSFYAAMRFMSPAQRRAMFEVYAFCRAVDDIADCCENPALRLEQLRQWRMDIAAIFAGAPAAAHRELHCAVQRYDLRQSDFIDVLDGMEMDVTSPICAPEWAILDLYCDRVASAVGRMCVRIFGIDGKPGLLIAHHLGRALQLTNILRDIDEDAAMGRLYLPREPLLAAGIASTIPAEAIRHPHLGHACIPVANVAERHFKEADMLMAQQPRAATRAPRLMADVYRTTLSRLLKRGWGLPRSSVKLGRLQIARLLLRNILA